MEIRGVQEKERKEDYSEDKLQGRRATREVKEGHFQLEANYLDI